MGAHVERPSPLDEGAVVPDLDLVEGLRVVADLDPPVG